MNNQCAWCSKLLPLQDRTGRPLTYCPPPAGCKYHAYRDRRDNELRGNLPRNNNHLDLIFCAGNNREFMQIAYETGYLLGVRSDCSAYDYSIHFVDNHYKNPKWSKHLNVVKKHQPKYATIPDLSEEIVSSADVERAMKQYDQLSSYCEIPLIIPKLPGQIAMLSKKVKIAYSVRTSYGGALYDLGELEDKDVHLLGGNPDEQMKIFKALAGRANVMSADGNMAMNVARNFAQYWDRGWVDHPEKGKTEKPLYLECWQWSCRNIKREWSRLVDVSLEVQQPTLWQ